MSEVIGGQNASEDKVCVRVLFTGFPKPIEDRISKCLGRHTIARKVIQPTGDDDRVRYPKLAFVLKYIPFSVWLSAFS